MRLFRLFLCLSEFNTYYLYRSCRSGTEDFAGLRQLGYVFWDVARVMPEAMFDINKNESVNFRFSPSRVRPSSSALEEMLAPANIALKKV